MDGNARDGRAGIHARGRVDSDPGQRVPLSPRPPDAGHKRAAPADACAEATGTELPAIGGLTGWLAPQGASVKLGRMLDDLRKITQEHEALRLPPVPPRHPRASPQPPAGSRHYEADTHAHLCRVRETCMSAHLVSYVPGRIMEIRGYDEDALFEWQEKCLQTAKERALRVLQLRAASPGTPPRSPAERRERCRLTTEQRNRLQRRRRRAVVSDYRDHTDRRWRAALRRQSLLSDTERRSLGLQTVMAQWMSMCMFPAYLLLGRMRRRREVHLATVYGTRWRTNAALMARRNVERQALAVLSRNFRRKFLNMRIAKKNNSADFIRQLLRCVANSNRAGRAIHHYRHCIILVQGWWRAHVQERAAWLHLLHRQWLKHDRLRASYSAEPPHQQRRGSRGSFSCTPGPGDFGKGTTMILVDGGPAPAPGEPPTRSGSLRRRPSANSERERQHSGSPRRQSSAGSIELPRLPTDLSPVASPSRENIHTPSPSVMRVPSRGSLSGRSGSPMTRLARRQMRQVQAHVSFLAWKLPDCVEAYRKCVRQLHRDPAQKDFADIRSMLEFALVRWLRRRAQDNNRLFHQYVTAVDAYLKHKRYVHRIANFRAGTVSPTSRPTGAFPTGKYMGAQPQLRRGTRQGRKKDAEATMAERLKEFEESVRLGNERDFCVEHGLHLPTRSPGSRLMDRDEIAQLRVEMSKMQIVGAAVLHPPPMSPVPEQGEEQWEEREETALHSWFGTPLRRKKGRNRPEQKPLERLRSGSKLDGQAVQRSRSLKRMASEGSVRRMASAVLPAAERAPRLSQMASASRLTAVSGESRRKSSMRKGSSVRVRAAPPATASAGEVTLPTPSVPPHQSADRAEGSVASSASTMVAVVDFRTEQEVG